MLACCCRGASSKEDEVSSAPLQQTYGYTDESPEWEGDEGWDEWDENADWDDYCDDGTAAHYYDQPPEDMDVDEEPSESMAAPPSLKMTGQAPDMALYDEGDDDDKASGGDLEHLTAGMPLETVAEPCKSMPLETLAEPCKSMPSETVAEPCNIKQAASPPFAVTVKKPSATGSVGWHLDVLESSHLFICRVVKTNTGRSPVEVYNKTVPLERQVCSGDYVMAVNDVKLDSEGMADQIRTVQVLNLMIIRPELLLVKVDKNGQSLGIDLKYGPGGTTLLVENIREGACKRSAVDLRPGDRIVSVSGTTGAPNDLMQGIKDLQSLEFLVSRVPRE